MGLRELMGAPAASARPYKQRQSHGVRLWLSAALAQPFIMLPLAGLRGWHEASLAAASIAAEETSLSAPVQVWLEALPGARAALGVAVPEGLPSTLEREVSQCRLKIESMRPWWAKALDQILGSAPNCAMAAISDTEALVILAAEGDQWLAANAYDGAGVLQSAENTLQRRATALGIDSGRVARARLDADGTASPVAPRLVDSFDET